jgi:hypothetical protein
MTQKNNQQQEHSSVVAESSSDVKGKINGHTFQSHTYFTPAFCEHCRKLLKGIIRQVGAVCGLSFPGGFPGGAEYTRRGVGLGPARAAR